MIDVPSGPGIDNALATVRVEWASPGSDYDIEVYRDTNGNGMVDSGEPIEGDSAQGPTDFEQVTLGPDPSGRYIVIGSGIASVNEWANAIAEASRSMSGAPVPMKPAVGTLSQPRPIRSRVRAFPSSVASTTRTPRDRNQSTSALLDRSELAGADQLIDRRTAQP